MRSSISRRQFLRTVAQTSAVASLAGQLQTFAAPTPLTGRYITHVSVVRVNQIEVTRTRNLGKDEASLNFPKHIRARREGFRRGAPKGKMTWAISWLALTDQREEYKEARRLLAYYHDHYGDEVTFIPGGYFAPMYNSREEIRKTINDALGRIAHMVGNRYRPKSLVAGYMDSENMRQLVLDQGIHVCQGQVWSQHGIDNGDGDGGICYPYYPSRQHYLKPAQSPADHIDCVCLDGWTCDFLTARRNGFAGGFNSRLGVGPIETVGNLGPKRGHQEMLDTTAEHFDTGYKLNGFGFVTGIWETSLGFHDDLAWWLQTVHERWPDTQVITEGDFGLKWRQHNPTNAGLNYRFDQRGTGAPGSEPNLEIKWYMNRQFRLALMHDWQKDTPWVAIDFTRYDLPAHEPTGLQREWSLMNVLNMKGARPQDKPMRLSKFHAEDRRIIFTRYPELRKLA